ncbi:ribonuclease P protein component [Candidatus Daviesbacteria bacterium]|nr:ribonuclease P protein component [Candidatus Daviesbacteria bacterium]
MLPKSQRLNLKTDFKWVASGKKIESRYLKLFIRWGENKTPRVGIAVSSRIFKKATERNRVKRLVSQAVQSIIHDLPSTINIVALPKQSILNVKSGDVLLDVESKLKDEKII